MVASAASMAMLQTTQRVEPPWPSALRSKRNERAVVNKNRLYIRP